MIFLGKSDIVMMIIYQIKLFMLFNQVLKNILAFFYRNFLWNGVEFLLFIGLSGVDLTTSSIR